MFTNLNPLVDFIYETGILSKTPRSGLWFLGTGSQSVAEHLFRTALIGYVLSHLTPEANRDRVIFLCLLHDLGEGRTSDLNYVHQKYGRLAESKAVEDLAANLPFGGEILEACREASAKVSLEAKLAKDADQLEWLTTMREEAVKGNTKAQSWAEIAFQRIKTDAGKQLGQLLLTTHPDHWWFDETDKWFVDRDPELQPWKQAQT
ncbi:MAG: HD domain-containing protein [bacterium]|nr:HD domain-containing protein [bacterium]